MPIAWTARINPRTAIVSISTSFCSIPSPRRSRGCPPGSSARLADTIRLCPTETRCVRRSTMPAPCRNACSRRSTFDWHGDRPPRHPWSKTVIYETHVRGFTIHPSSGVKHPGTYRGLMEKIPYFTDLGVTAVELMPVQEFNEHQVTASIRKQASHSGITGATIPSSSVRPKRPIAVREVWASRSWSSRKWSRPSTRPASK